MKKLLMFSICFALAVFLIGCSPACISETPNIPEDAFTLRIVSINNGVLLLGGETEADVYTLSTSDLSVTENGKSLDIAELETGMTLQFHSYSVAETYPARLSAEKVEVIARDPIITDLIFNVFNDMYETDSGLNGGVDILGFDLSTVTSLTDGEKAAFMHAFSNKLGYSQYVSGTYEEFCDAGYIDGEQLYWEDGMLMRFTITEDGGDTIKFTAEKWRSGTGAIFYVDCNGTIKNGRWVYTPGSFAIS